MDAGREVAKHLAEIEKIKTGGKIETWEAYDNGHDSFSTATSRFVLNYDTHQFVHINDICCNGGNVPDGNQDRGYRPDRYYIKSIGTFEKLGDKIKFHIKSKLETEDDIQLAKYAQVEETLEGTLRPKKYTPDKIELYFERVYMPNTVYSWFEDHDLVEL